MACSTLTVSCSHHACLVPEYFVTPKGGPVEQCAPHTWTFEVSHTRRLWGPEWRLTCSHKEDAGAEDDVVLAAVEPPGSDAEPTEQEQDGAEDGEDAGGAHDA